MQVFSQILVQIVGAKFGTHMWKIKMPPNVKVFTWLVLNNAILSREN